MQRIFFFFFKWLGMSISSEVSKRALFTQEIFQNYLKRCGTLSLGPRTTPQKLSNSRKRADSLSQEHSEMHAGGWQARRRLWCQTWNRILVPKWLTLGTLSTFAECWPSHLQNGARNAFLSVLPQRTNDSVWKSRAPRFAPGTDTTEMVMAPAVVFMTSSLSIPDSGQR